MTNWINFKDAEPPTNNKYLVTVHLDYKKDLEVRLAQSFWFYEQKMIYYYPDAIGVDEVLYWADIPATNDPDWRKVDDYPDIGQWVLGLTNTDDVVLTKLMYDEPSWFGESEKLKIKKWMPLPKPA